MFVVFDDMQYTKRDWRNRNLIKTDTGLKWLTIPVETKGKYFQKINETKISDYNWNVKHWRLIKNYGVVEIMPTTKTMILLHNPCQYITG